MYMAEEGLETAKITEVRRSEIIDQQGDIKWDEGQDNIQDTYLYKYQFHICYINICINICTDGYYHLHICI